MLREAYKSITGVNTCIFGFQIVFAAGDLDTCSKLVTFTVNRLLFSWSSFSFCLLHHSHLTICLQQNIVLNFEKEKSTAKKRTKVNEKKNT